MPVNITEIERRLWPTAGNLRASSKLRSHEYNTPLLGLIFLFKLVSEVSALDVRGPWLEPAKEVVAQCRRS